MDPEETPTESTTEPTPEPVQPVAEQVAIAKKIAATPLATETKIVEAAGVKVAVGKLRVTDTEITIDGTPVPNVVSFNLTKLPGSPWTASITSIVDPRVK